MSQIYKFCFIFGSDWGFDPNRKTIIRDIIEQTYGKAILN